MKAKPTACPIIPARTTAVTKMSKQQGKNYGTPRMHHVLSAVRCIKLRFKYSRPELVLVVVFHYIVHFCGNFTADKQILFSANDAGESVM